MRRFLLMFPVSPRQGNEEFDTFEEVADRIVRRHSETDLVDVYETTPVFSVPGEQRFALTHVLSISGGRVLAPGHPHYQGIYNDVRATVRPDEPNPQRVFDAYSNRIGNGIGFAGGTQSEGD